MIKNNYKGLRIATISGKGADGCGVQRTSGELQLWAKKVDAVVDYYAYDKKFGRSAGHNMEINIFNLKNIKEKAQFINDNYDIVMFMNYPSNKHDVNYIKAFYYDFFDKINKPLKAFYEHDIHKGQIDKTPYLIPMLANSDIVFHFDIDTWFSKALHNLDIKHINNRLHKYTLWINLDELNIYRQRYYNKKKKGLSSVTRWSSLKNVRRTIDIIDEWQKKDKNISGKVYGIERSIGAKFDIIDYDKTIYVNTSGTKNNEKKGTVEVYGPVKRNEGLDHVSSHLFSSSFFSLPKIPENYGNRMEYTQIEIIGVGTIPIFDKHWAENNTISNGKKYIDIPYSAIYTDGNNIEEIILTLEEISNDKNLRDKYLNTSYNIIKEEFDAEKVIPKAIDLIIKTGKLNENKTVYDICKQYVNKTFADEIIKLEKENKLPVMNIDAFENKSIYYLENGKKTFIKKIKKENSKSLF